jgi:outer membrane receptor protein involved in Fe transport
MKNYISTFLCFVFLNLIGFALLGQNGKIRGTIIDGENGEPLFSGNAVVKGTQVGTTSDFDGNYELSVPAGTYNLELSFIGYKSLTITGVVVKANEVTVMNPVTLEVSSNELEEVVISVEVAKNTEQALLTLKKKSVTVVDGISAAKLRLTGDSDAGDAAKRVTGVSVEGGKYVYVRGLGDRYTKTMLNDIDIPGLDPDRNAVQIDIFPTNLISNMTVVKSATASLPADFAGGIVNIETKAFPEQRVLSVSAGIGYNPSMHFNSNYLSYDGGSTDFLGFDDGARTLPSAAENEPIPNPPNGSSSDEVNSFVNSFNPTLGATERTSLPNGSLGISFGDQKLLENGNKLGYIFAATYKNETRYYDDVAFGEYVLPRTSDDYELEPTTLRTGSLGESNVLMGGLAGIAYKSNLAKYRVTLMHLQNGESTAGQFEVFNSENIGQSGYEAFSNNLNYSQRALTNLLFEGDHYTEDDSREISWKISPTYSRITDPDLRSTAFTITVQGDSIFNAGAGGYPQRIWRYLDEINNVSKVNVTLKKQLFDRDAKVGFGASHLFKYRNYNILTFEMQSQAQNPVFNGDPNQVLDPDNIFPNLPGLYYNSSNGDPNPNQYNSTVNNFGGYGSLEMEPSLRLKVILGLRAEYYLQTHTGRDQLGARRSGPNDTQGNVLDNDVVLNSLDLFPSANVIYALNENQNLRVSYFRSIARPSFKELSFAQILDPISDRTFNGGLLPYEDEDGNVVWDGNLSETRINNFDVRWEIFDETGGLISFSGFVKLFDDAIELVRIPEAQTSSDFQVRNVGDGQVFGGEFELIKSLAFISEGLRPLNFSGNFTYVYSSIQMTDTEFDIRKQFEKEGQTVQNTRAMQGQAPYIVNAGFSYNNKNKKLNLGAFYNVKGRTLEIVGGGLFPDVYTEVFHSLNITAGKTFGEEDKSSLTLKVSNLLGDVRESFFTGFEAQDQIFTRLAPGTEISLGYSYRF